MGFLSKKLGIKALSIEDPSQPLLPYSALFESLGLGRSDAGNLVNETQAMRLTTMFACVNIISQDLSTLPMNIYEVNPDDSVKIAKSHRLFPLLHNKPNPTMTSLVFRKALLANALAWGNGYAFIRRDNASRAISLHILPPTVTSPVQVDGVLKYATTATTDGAVSYIDVADMIHLKGLTLSGEIGLSPVQTCKNAFGLSLAQESFSARFYGNGLRTTGVLSHPENLDAEAYENLKKSIHEIATGENAMRPLILEEGMTWTQMSIAPNDAQFVESRNFQVREICSLYRVSTTLVGDLSRATHSNTEQLSRDHLLFCLMPWAKNLEEELTSKLLTGNFIVEHDFSEFLRADFTSQTAGLKLLRDVGAYSANDIRRALRQNPIPEEMGGDVRLAPLNMVPIESLVKIYADDAGGKVDPVPQLPVARTSTINAYSRMFRDAVGRITNRTAPDEQFAYRVLYPIVAAMAVLITGAPDGNLSATTQQAVYDLTTTLSAPSKDWNKEDAATITANITTEAYEHLCTLQK